MLVLLQALKLIQVRATSKSRNARDRTRVMLTHPTSGLEQPPNAGQFEGNISNSAHCQVIPLPTPAFPQARITQAPQDPPSVATYSDQTIEKSNSSRERGGRRGVAYGVESGGGVDGEQ
jgi:hypothetical protein